MVLGGIFVVLSTLSGVSEIGGGDAEFEVEADPNSDFEIGPDAGVDVDGDFDVDSGGGEMALDQINFDFGTLDTEVTDLGNETALETQSTDPEVYTQSRQFRPYLSFRFWTFLTAFFGLTGTLFTVFEVWASTIGVLGISGGMGISAGLFVAYLMHRFGQGEYSKALEGHDFLGASGTVQLPVTPNEEGKVRLRLRGQLVDMFAVSYSDESFERGDECFVVDVDQDAGTVEIISVQAAKSRVFQE
jgi:hypothetical protein